MSIFPSKPTAHIGTGWVGEVEYYSNLPDPSLFAGRIFSVKKGEGVLFPILRKRAGLYTPNDGGTSWYRLGSVKEYFDDVNFEISDDADSSKKLHFQTGSISTGQVRVLEAQDRSGIITLQEDLIGQDDTHETLDQLIHEIAETSYDEIIEDANGDITNYIIWTDSGKTQKIREEIITYDENGDPTLAVTKQYDSASALERTLTETPLNWINGFPTNFNVVKS